MWASEDWPPIHLKTYTHNVSVSGEPQSGCGHLTGEVQGLAHFLWQQVDVLLVSSLRSAVQFYQSQGLRVQVSVILTQRSLNSKLFKKYYT